MKNTMKKYFNILIILSILVAASCSQEEAMEPKFTLDTNKVTISDGNAGETDILLSSNVDLVAEVSEDDVSWLSATVSRRCLTLSYSVNDSGEERSANVLVKAGELQQVVLVVQSVYIPPKEGYEVGDLVDEGRGVIYWVDPADKNIAKAISVNRVKGKKWSTDGSAAGTNWFVNGSENAQKLKGEKYEAALWCAAMGDGWYLPARDEMLEIFEIYNGTTVTDATVAQPGSITDQEKASRTAFDALLTAASADAMNTAGDTANGDSYWTSTESETDPSMVYYIRFGKFLNEPISKTSTSRYTRCVKVYGDYEYGPEPELPDSEEPEQGGDEPGQGGDNPGGDNPDADNPGGNVGDLAVGNVWNEGSKVVGVVFWVAEDGKSGKIVSLNRTKTTIAWSTVGNEYLGAGSKSDGATNTAILKASSQAADIPMLEFCKELGDEWYWPACMELNKVYPVKDIVDSALSANGGMPFGTDQYWSSTEFETAPKYASHVRFDKDYYGGEKDEINKTGNTKRYGRCVKKIELQ